MGKEKVIHRFCRHSNKCFGASGIPQYLGRLEIILKHKRISPSQNDNFGCCKIWDRESRVVRVHGLAKALML